MPLSFHAGVHKTGSRNRNGRGSLTYLKTNPQLDTVVTSLKAVGEAIMLARDEWWKDLDEEVHVRTIKQCNEEQKNKEDDDETVMNDNMEEEEFVDLQKKEVESLAQEDHDDEEIQEEKSQKKPQWMTPPEEESVSEKYANQNANEPKKRPLCPPSNKEECKEMVIDVRAKENEILESVSNYKLGSLKKKTKVNNDKRTESQSTLSIRKNSRSNNDSKGDKPLSIDLMTDLNTVTHKETKIGHDEIEGYKPTLSNSKRTKIAKDSHVDDAVSNKLAFAITNQKSCVLTDPDNSASINITVTKMPQSIADVQKGDENNDNDQGGMDDNCDDLEEDDSQFCTLTYPSVASLPLSEPIPDPVQTPASKFSSPPNTLSSNVLKFPYPGTIDPESNSVEPSPLPTPSNGFHSSLSSQLSILPIFMCATKLPKVSKPNIEDKPENTPTTKKNSLRRSKEELREDMTTGQESTKTTENKIAEIVPLNLEKSTSDPPMILMLSSSSGAQPSLQKWLRFHYGLPKSAKSKSDSSINSSPKEDEFLVSLKTISSSSLYALSVHSEFATGDGFLVSRSFPYALAVAKGMLIVDQTFLRDRTTSNEDPLDDSVSSDKQWLYPKEYPTESNASDSKHRNSTNDTKDACKQNYHIIGDVKSEQWMAPQKAREAKMANISVGCGLFDKYTIVLVGEFDLLKGRNKGGRTRSRSRGHGSNRQVHVKQENDTKTNMETEPNSCLYLEEPKLFTRERIKVIMKLCQANVLDMNDPVEKVMLENIISTSTKKDLEFLIFMIRPKANVRDFRLGQKIVDQYELSASQVMKGELDFPLVNSNWALDSLFNFELRPIEIYSRGGKSKKVKYP